VIAMMVDELPVSRRVAAWIVGALAWCTGLVSVYSFTEIQFSFYYFGEERTHGYFDFFNIVATHVLLPLTALLIALFAGWCMPTKDDTNGERVRPFISYRLWRFCTRYIAPFILAAVLLLVLLYPA
jgi:NSS family neurotransmitter:Na+ symporter